MSDSTLLASALRTKKTHGIGLMRQVWQATRLRYGPGRLDPWEYYFFEVFHDRYAWEEKRRFFGWRGELALDQHFNRGPARAIANDKLKFHAKMREIGAPVPDVAAVYAIDGTDTDNINCIRSADAAARFIGTTDDLPLFVKPLRGAHGWGTAAIAGRDGDTLELASGERIATDDFVAGLEPGARGGYLFQEKLSTHPAIAERCGNRLTSARIVVLRAHEDAITMSAVWRIPTGRNMTDNFSAGANGNLCAAIDIETGTVGDVFQGIGWEIRQVEAHPDTRETLAGLQLPGWRRALRLCLECSDQLPDLRLQHWDVAISDRGPVLLELNVLGGLRTHQIVAAGPKNLRPLAHIWPPT